MAGYSKNIAVIRGIQEGFSADGGELSGIVKAEKYGKNLSVEVTYINFAPLSQGRFITAVSDGANTVIVENGLFEGQSDLDTAKGFAALTCFINGGVFPVATAICGNYRGEALGIKAEVERLENLKAGEKSGDKKSKNAADEVYEDEAIAEENYYEYEPNENGDSLRADKKEKEVGAETYENATAAGSFQKDENGAYIGGNGLASGDFFAQKRGEIEKLLAEYPKFQPLENMIEGSKWVKIPYGEDKFYVFGVLYAGGNAEYICYGVPSGDGSAPPEEMKGQASFIPTTAAGGFWIMYQDAKTGATVKAETE